MTTLPTPRERPWLTVAEVATITGEGEKVIRTAVDAGQIPVLRIGRYVRIPTAAFLDLCGISPDMSEAALPGAAIATIPPAHQEKLDDTHRIVQSA